MDKVENKKIDIQNLNKEAKLNAIKHICNVFQRPHQLEKVDQHKKRILRKNASVEGLLKTAMQTQLDGVKSGFIHLKTALNDIQEVNSNLKEDEETLITIPNRVDKLKNVREESMKHTQYAAAMENLKHIFSVPESVQRTRESIAQGKLLKAHQELSELENSRDGLLYEMHRLPSTNPADKNMLKHYFSEVEKLSDELGKQLWLHIRMTLNSAKINPSVIVTALRIIEREERSDEIAQKKYDSLGFMPHGRPKQWKKRVFEILEEAISERISGSQSEDRSREKMWLARHLEMVRQLILNDLKVVKYACVNCFPPSYMIVSEMLKLYHRCLSSHLQEIALLLEGNEYVTMLNWGKAYEGPTLLGHPDLKFDLKSENLEPLLSNELTEGLSNKFLQTIEKNYKDWLSNTINRETKDWYGNSLPESDNNHYHTTTPVIVFAMIDQHLEVARGVSKQLALKVLAISLEHLTSFAKQYKEAIGHFSKLHIEDRSKYKCFIPYMIAVTNNCLSFPEKVKELYIPFILASNKSDNNDFTASLSTVEEAFESLRKSNLRLLLKDLFLDIEKGIQKVGSREWIDDNGNATESVRLTIDDYMNDYMHLRNQNFEDLRVILQNRLVVYYLQALFQKKVTFRDAQQREKFAKKFEDEIRILRSAIARLPNYSDEPIESPFACFDKLIACLKLKDINTLYLDISALVKAYPDITIDHLTCLLSLREDLSKMNIRKTVTDMMADIEQLRTDKKTIFTQLDIT